MKSFFTIILISLAFLITTGASAQMPAPYGTEGSRSGMSNFSNSTADWNEVVEHTTKGEQEGKVVWDKLQSKQVQCADLSDEDFDALGEYFMGQMTGDSHAAMNAMMMQVHGEEGEEQIHIVMGKRLSGCDTSAVFPGTTGGWMPMMNMMTGRWSSPFGLNSTNNMMNFGSFGLFGGLFTILWWVLIIVAVIALIKWLANQLKGGSSSGKSALDILKERYAKGEINKQEFEDKKKDLN